MGCFRELDVDPDSWPCEKCDADGEKRKMFECRGNGLVVCVHCGTWRENKFCHLCKMDRHSIQSWRIGEHLANCASMHSDMTGERALMLYASTYLTGDPSHLAFRERELSRVRHLLKQTGRVAVSSLLFSSLMGYHAWSLSSDGMAVFGYVDLAALIIVLVLTFALGPALWPPWDGKPE